MAIVLYQFAELKLSPLCYIQAFYVHRCAACRTIWKLFGDCYLLGILISVIQHLFCQYYTRFKKRNLRSKNFKCVTFLRLPFQSNCNHILDCQLVACTFCKIVLNVLNIFLDFKYIPDILSL